MLPHRRALACGAFVGRALGRAVPRRREIALCNLRIAFPDWSEEQRLRVFRESCENLGRSAVELLTLGGATPDELRARTEIIGLEHLERALESSAPGGVIAMTAHLGNWEMFAALMHAHGYELTVVARARENPLLERFVERLRGAWGVELLTRGEAARGALRAIRGGKILALPLDQNCNRDEGEFIPFFGRLACTRKAPAKLAMRTGAPIVPAFIERIDSGERHRVHIAPPLELEYDAEGALRANLGLINATIERAVRRFPGQWTWMHRRFHTQPFGEPRPYPSKRSRRGPVLAG